MERLPYPESRLTQSFRFGEKIADVANILLKTLQEQIPLTGNPMQKSMIGTLASAQKNVILCRTNVNALEHLLEGQKIGKRPILNADSNSILQFCEGAEKLKSNQSAHNVSALIHFKNWQEVREFSEQEEGSYLKPWVRVIDRYGTGAISLAIKKQANEQNPHYSICTAHKTSLSIAKEELRLLYVACTRAQEILDISSICPLFSALKSKKVIFSDIKST